jgi:hypothetical protein
MGDLTASIVGFGFPDPDNSRINQRMKRYSAIRIM